MRGTAVREVVGGKGNNVARALTRLGRTAAGHISGWLRRPRCETLLRRRRLDPLVVPTEAPTRVILTVRTEATTEQTAFFDPDPAIAPAEAEAMLARVEEALRRRSRR